MADVYDATKDGWGGNGSAGNYPGAPARRFLAVTPSDTKDLPNAAGDNASAYAKGLYIGTGGNVAVVAAGDQSNTLQGTAVTWKNLPSGSYLLGQVRRVMSTNTTATDIVALYDR